MKDGARYIAIASGPIGKNPKALLVGVIFKDGYIEGLLSTTIERDGTDSTTKITRMIKRSRFNDQIRILLFNGIALAGLNIVDYKVLHKELKSDVLLLNRRKQEPKELIHALETFSRLNKVDVTKQIGLVNESIALSSLKENNLFLQSTLEKHYMKRFSERTFEALRIAHIIARGISTGESKGRL